MSWITKALGLDAWKDGLTIDQVEQHIHKFDTGSFYIVQVSEKTTPEQADAIRRTLESHGVYSIVIAVDTVRVLSLASKS